MTGVQNIIYTRIEEEKINQLGRKKAQSKYELEVSQGMSRNRSKQNEERRDPLKLTNTYKYNPTPSFVN